MISIGDRSCSPWMSDDSSHIWSSDQVAILTNLKKLTLPRFPLYHIETHCALPSGSLPAFTGQLTSSDPGESWYKSKFCHRPWSHVVGCSWAPGAALPSSWWTLQTAEPPHHSCSQDPQSPAPSHTAGTQTSCPWFTEKRKQFHLTASTQNVNCSEAWFYCTALKQSSVSFHTKAIHTHLQTVLPCPPNWFFEAKFSLFFSSLAKMHSNVGWWWQQLCLEIALANDANQMQNNLSEIAQNCFQLSSIFGLHDTTQNLCYILYCVVFLWYCILFMVSNCLLLFSCNCNGLSNFGLFISIAKNYTGILIKSRRTNEGNTWALTHFLWTR